MSKKKTFFIDIGNTSLKYCSYHNGDYQIENSLEAKDVNKERVEQLFSGTYCLICSVVPDIDGLFKSIRSIECVFISPAAIPYISTHVDHVEQVG
ncbi:hypothetical protein DID78_06235, partial [Candidatus Marinamargulisbacteria bacterium SCGC AG-343-D04]